jgi:hypothetical protein
MLMQEIVSCSWKVSPLREDAGFWVMSESLCFVV